MERVVGGMKLKVMVAIDDSESSEYALEWTLKKFGDSIRSSELIIFTAQPVSDLGYLYASSHGLAPFELVTSLQDHHKQIAEALLDQAKALCNIFRVTVSQLFPFLPKIVSSQFYNLIDHFVFMDHEFTNNS